MTIKSTKELLTGDSATLIIRLLMIVGIGYSGIQSKEGSDNTEAIKTSLARLEEKHISIEQRIQRNEIVDANEHAQLRSQNEEQRKEFHDFKDKYFLIPKPFNKKSND